MIKTSSYVFDKTAVCRRHGLQCAGLLQDRGDTDGNAGAKAFPGENVEFSVILTEQGKTFADITQTVPGGTGLQRPDGFFRHAVAVVFHFDVDTVISHPCPDAQLLFGLFAVEDAVKQGVFQQRLQGKLGNLVQLHRAFDFEIDGKAVLEALPVRG